MTPEAIELVEEGLVAPETIVARGKQSAASATYLSLAAEATFLRGDLVSTIRYLREGVQSESEFSTALPHIYFRSRAGVTGSQRHPRPRGHTGAPSRCSLAEF